MSSPREALTALQVAHAAYMAAKRVIVDIVDDDTAKAAARIEDDMARIERALRKQIYG